MATLPAAVLFLALPVELYLPNQGEYGYQLIVLIPYPILFALWVLAWLGVSCFLPSSRRSTVAVALLWFGLFLLLSDIVAPVQLGPLDGTQLQPKEPLELTIREAVIGAAILLAAWKVPVLWARQLGVAFAALLLLFQPLYLWHGFSPGIHLNKDDAEFQPHPPPAPLSLQPNLYHITWDAHGSYAFEESLRDAALAEEFDGFLFFRENRSNYVFTEPSVASYMTGTFYEQGPIVGWVRKRFPAEVGVVAEVSRAGFEVWDYEHSPYYIHPQASHAATNLGMMAEADSPTLVANFADLWLLRAVPNFLQDEVYFDGKGVGSRLLRALESHHPYRPPPAAGELESRAYFSVGLARRLIQEEGLRPVRGQYVYAHIYLPHAPAPYLLNSECEYQPQGIASDRDAYYRQSQCATKLMVEFIRELKRQGRYKESAIIFHSDHATWEYGPSAPHSLEGSLRNADQIQDNLKRLTPTEIDRLTRSLLLVKPPGRAGVPLEISDRPTQLADLPATVYDVLGISPAVLPKEGLSVLSDQFPSDREIHMFFGYKQIAPNGRVIYLGRDDQKGEMNHFSYAPSLGWKRYANVQVNQ